ncbi:MAG TPA: hypothetical protein VGA61_00660 [Anaerolineae bacterium]
MPEEATGRFGIWTIGLPQDSAGVAQAATAPAGQAAGAGRPQDRPGEVPGGSQWRVVLPADPAAARALLDTQQAAIKQQRDALDYARRMLDDAADRQKLHRRRQLAASAPAGLPVVPAQASASIPPGAAAMAAIVARPLLGPAALPAVPPPISPAETALLHRLNALPGETAAGTSSPAPALGISIQAPWDQAVQFAQQWQTFAGDVMNLVANYADVQTEITPASEGPGPARSQIIGRTLVDWGGNFRTTWGASGLTGTQMALHAQSVHLALASRLALIHLVGTVAASAVTLVLASPTVIAFTLALPAVFQSVKDAIDEYLALQKPTAN